MSEQPASAEKDAGLTVDQACDLLLPIFKQMDALRAAVEDLDRAVMAVMKRVMSPGECNGMCVMDETGYVVEHPHPGCPAHGGRVLPPAE